MIRRWPLRSNKTSPFTILDLNCQLLENDLFLQLARFSHKKFSKSFVGVEGIRVFLLLSAPILEMP